MSSEGRPFATGGWQVDWQAWPFESDNAGPSSALPSSHLDITQGAYVQDMQPQFNFDDFGYDNLDFNAENPDFADIFNAGEPETAMPAIPVDSLEQQQDQIVAVQAAAPRRPRRPRTQGPSPGQWNAQKTAIYDLYMAQDKTLKETMETLKDTHDFVATPQMFKEKCQEWGFVKNISRGVAGKLLRIADERKPKGTEFRLGARKWTTAEIRKKCERRTKNGDPQIRVESPELPSNLTYRTPTVSPVVQNSLMRQRSLSIPKSPASFFYTASAMPVRAWRTPEVPGPVNAHSRPLTPFNIASPRASASSWAPIHSPRQPSLFQGRMLPPPPPLPFVTASFPWQKTTPTNRLLLHSLQPLATQSSLQDLKNTRSSALRLVQQGKVDHAIERLRVVISGFETLLSPTHHLTVDASYELAELLGSHNKKGEASSLLDWLGSEIVSAYGLRSERAILHYIKVVKLLRSWSRDEDARLLLCKIADVWNKDLPCPAPKIPRSLAGDAMLAGIPATDIQKLFREPVDESDADVQLQLVDLLLSSTNDLSSELEDELRRITSYCESGQMTPQTIHARHCLSRFYAAGRMKEKAMEVLDAVIPMLEKALRFDECAAPSSHLLQHCRALAFAYYDLDDLVKCEHVLELTTAGLERYTHPHGPVPQIAIVNFPFAAGIMWQKRHSWELAEPWIERALLNAIKGLGKSHEKAIMLERTLEDRTTPSTNGDILSSTITDDRKTMWETS